MVAITEAQGPVEGAQDSLNSLIQSKKSLEMTKTELKNLGIATTSLETEIKKLAEEVGKAAAAYAAVEMTTEPKIQNLKASIRMVPSEVESPIDHVKTEIKTMPLAADTMNMDM